MTFIPKVSWLSTNSRSNRSIKISRFPGCSVYCLNSTTRQQSCICLKLSPVGSVMTHLSMASVEMKKAKVRTLRLHSYSSVHRKRHRLCRGYRPQSATAATVFFFDSYEDNDCMQFAGSL